ncbi:MAG TPA: chorismate-binding protein [Candidatus Cybelea sp.]|nr:chorismate-binding protein [Candidatus Cybelea sp.]
MTFRVVLGTAPAQLFERPRELVRAAGAAELHEALDIAGRALDAGSWIAGYVTYDRTAALGIFDAPRTVELPDPPSPPPNAALLATVAYDDYADAIASLQRSIYDGDVYQVNFTFPFDFAIAGNPFDLYAYFARRSGAQYQAYVEDGDRALLSWSPELWVSFDADAVRTKPMKGTAPLDRVEDLRNGKNRAEHVMIVDLLRNDLHRVCDRVDVERFLETERYPSYVTMTSTIAGRPRAGVCLADIFEAAFPCGSVTGAPKRAAMRFIELHETAPRAAYCGTIGALSPQRRGWWNVAIRTAQVDLMTGAARYDAGGGIVADSNARDEWSEVRLKTRFLRDGESSFAILETFASDAGDETIERHLARMRASAEAFGVSLDLASFERFSEDDKIVRLRLYLDGRLETLVEAKATPAEVRICLSAQRVRSNDPFLRHKTSWRPAQDAAAREATARECFDALLQNERGELTEGSRTNLFVQRDGVLWTPPLSSGLLAGILRERLVAEGRALERVLTVDDVRGAEAVFAGNSARGLLRATFVEYESQ